jgi:hypothetical protein
MANNEWLIPKSEILQAAANLCITIPPYDAVNIANTLTTLLPAERVLSNPAFVGGMCAVDLVLRSPDKFPHSVLLNGAKWIYSSLIV